MSELEEEELELSGLEKASILLLALGVDASAKVLQQMNEAEIERLLAALNKVAMIPLEKRYEVVKEAFELASSGSVSIADGVEYSRQLLARAVGPRRGAEILDRISAQQQLSSFEMLRTADAQRVASLLQDELPQTIALVLSYLDARTAADILTNLPREMQVEVTLRLAVMDRVSPQVVQVVERGLKEKLSSIVNAADFRATGGITFLVKMLNQVERGVQKAILEAIERENPSLADEVRASMFTFDDLVKLDDRTMQRVLREVNKTDLALALKGAPEKLRDAILRNLSERARENLLEEVEILGPQLAKNVYSAQRRIVDVVRQLEDDGEIVISEGGGGDNELIA